MACRRGNCRTPLCSALLDCIQLTQDDGRGCDELADGYSRLQINAAGNLEVCSNVGGVCDCEELTEGGTDTLVNNGDGTFTHTSVDGVITVIDICTLIGDGGCADTLVNNGDGTFTHTAIDGIVTVVDICTLIGDGGCFDTLVNNGDGTFTHTAVDGTVTVIDVCTLIGDGGCTDTLVNNGDGTFTHTAIGGTVTVIDICTLLGDGGCADTLVNNGNGTFTHTAVDGTVTVVDVCAMIGDGTCRDTLVNNGDGTFTHTDLQGNAVIIDVCGLVDDGGCTDTLVNNGNGTFTHTDLQGNAVIIDVCTLVDDGGCTDTLVNNGNGTYTHTAIDGTVTVINVCNAITVVDTNCINLTQAATATGCSIQADIVLGGAVGGCQNATVCNADGLYTPALQFNDTNCIDLTLAGCVVTANPVIDPDACNGLECRANGMFVNNDIQAVALQATTASGAFVVGLGGIPAGFTQFGGTTTLNVTNPSNCNPMAFTRTVPASTANIINSCGLVANVEGALQYSTNGGGTWNTIETSIVTVQPGTTATMTMAGLASAFLQAVGATNLFMTRTVFRNPDGNFCGTFSNGDQSVAITGVNYIN